MTSERKAGYKSDRYYEIVVRTEAQGETERIKLRSFPLLIGSGDTCHLTLHYDAIVTTHLRVLVTYSGHVLLSNLGGAGTAIMEAKPIPVYVPIYWKPGQMIKLGPVELQLQMVIVDSSDTGDREKIQSVVITREINRVRDDTETRIPSSSNSSLPSSSQDETTTMPEPDTTADNSTDPQDKAGMHAPASEESPAEGENGAQPDPSVTAAAMDSQSKSDTAINRASVVITESDETPDNRVKPEPEDEREPKNDDTSGAYLDELFKGMVVNVSDIIGTDETSSEQQIATTQSGVANHLDVQSVPSTRLQSEITTTASFNNTGMIHPSTGVSLPKNWNHTATFAVSWSQRSLRLVMGQPVRLTIAVAGLTAQRTRVHLAIAGVPRDCIQLASNTFDLKPGHIETIIMILNVPRETAPLPERLVLRLYDEMNPAVASHCAVQLNFRTLPNLTGFIEPETGSPGTGAFVKLQNHTTVPFSTTLTWHSDVKQLAVILPQTEVNLPPGETVMLPLRFDGVRRSWLKSTTVGYSICASQPQSAPLFIRGSIEIAPRVSRVAFQSIIAIFIVILVIFLLQIRG